jgi:SAM-dependent methyltransferase
MPDVGVIRESMTMTISNCYADAERAAAYATLDFPGTYYLAFRDLPQIIGPPAPGARALDFGCGAGRSTRFLSSLGFDAVGVDIAADMIAQARRLDPAGAYRLIADADLEPLAGERFQVVLSAFTFDNIPTEAAKLANLRAIRSRLADGGRFVNLVSSPEIYCHEWASFTTREFPENRTARSGDVVRIVMTDVADRRPVEDVVCTYEAYRRLYVQAGLWELQVHRPLGRADDPVAWVSETEIPPWTVSVLRRCEL